MTFRLRAAHASDIEPLYEMAKLTGGGFTNLPADRTALESKLARADAAFSRDGDIADDYFVLVLENTETGQVRGTSQLMSQVGQRWPFYSYRLNTLTQYSKELDRTVRAELLFLTTDLEGSSEVGGLFLHPAERAGGLGMLLARSRYLFIAMHRPRFAQRILAELRGVIDDRGGSPFWDGVAGRFFGMNFQDADYFNAINGNQFIADLMPKHPVYVAMLGEEAKRVIGVPHPSGRAAMRMLEAEGFAHEGYVDIFDGGPTMTARTDQVKSVREATPGMLVGCDLDIGQRCLLAAGTLGSFRAAYGMREARGDGEIAIDGRAARLLEVSDGDEVERGTVMPAAPVPPPPVRVERSSSAAENAVETPVVAVSRRARRALRTAARHERMWDRMSLTEINFDGIVGPSHNYAGLSLGNIASASHKGEASFPRAAALQGIAKMRGNMALGLPQGFLLPLPRPNHGLLRDLGVDAATDRALLAAAWSASSMWTANAATVSPAPDTGDGRCHLTPANLVTMLHRGQEWRDTAKQLRIAFADERHFAVHDAVPPSFGDEGAANHMRLCETHDAPGVEVFVYGRPGGRFPARQHEQASRAIARLHGLDPARCVFIEQNPEAIAAGAFHNDVVAVANDRVLFTHARAFADQQGAFAAIRAAFPALEVVEVPEDAVSLAEAIRTYLFNAQLLTLPDGDPGSGSGAGMALVVPDECRASGSVWRWCEGMLASNGPIRRVIPVDVRQSMANGGGPACLRLRVVADPATVDQRFMLDEAKAQRIEAVIAEMWPQRIAPAQIGDPALAREVRDAREALLGVLGLDELL